MPRTDDPTVFVPKPRADFRTANPDVFAKAQGDVDTIRRLGAIELRADAIKQRFCEHFDRNEESWVAREALKLVAKRTFPTFEHPAPRGFEARRTGADFAELMMTRARQNVHARAIQRTTAINAIKTNLQNALIRNRPQQRQESQERKKEQERVPANDHRPKPTIKQKSP